MAAGGRRNNRHKVEGEQEIGWAMSFKSPQWQLLRFPLSFFQTNLSMLAKPLYEWHCLLFSNRNTPRNETVKSYRCFKYVFSRTIVTADYGVGRQLEVNVFPTPQKKDFSLVDGSFLPVSIHLHVQYCRQLRFLNMRIAGYAHCVQENWSCELWATVYLQEGSVTLQATANLFIIMSKFSMGWFSLWNCSWLADCLVKAEQQGWVQSSCKRCKEQLDWRRTNACTWIQTGSTG